MASEGDSCALGRKRSLNTRKHDQKVGAGSPCRHNKTLGVQSTIKKNGLLMIRSGTSSGECIDLFGLLGISFEMNIISHVAWFG